MISIRSWTCLAAGFACAAVASLILAPAWLAAHTSPRFRNVRELKTWAEARGLHCRSDAKDGRVVRSLAVSTRPLSWGAVNRLGVLRLPGREGGLAGIVWAVNRGTALDRLEAAPWDGECRAWGGVLVTGDPDLLDRIERGELLAAAGDTEQGARK